MEIFATYFLVFMIYSFAGWLLETVLKSLWYRRFINRGFLIGPCCPIYGVGVLAITFLLEQYKSDAVVTFFLAFIIIGVLEYITSIIMEKVFHARWWDYSKKPFNVDGRICLQNLLYFGFISLGVIYVFNPPIFEFINNLGDAKIWISIVLAIILGADIAISTTVLAGISREGRNLNKDNTEEMANKVRQTLKERNWSYRRILTAFPDMRHIIKKQKEKIKKLRKKSK